MYRVGVVSLFPELVEPVVKFGVVGRACERGLLSLEQVSPREFATGTIPSSPVSSPSLPRNAASAGRIARILPSSTLSAIPSRSGPAAQKRPSAPPFAVQPSSSRTACAAARSGARFGRITSISPEPSTLTRTRRARGERRIV